MVVFWVKMGNWKRNQRRNYSYESPRSHHTGPAPRPPPHPGLWQNSVPSWEKRFCTSVGIPWGKVVDAKKYIHYHVDVLNWNDLAGEEAFHNAKRRFWAEINGIPCSISQPDPDIYIDNIDWNPYIDPELMRNLDKEFFAPDEREQDCKLGDSNQKTNCPLPGHTAEGYDRNPASGDNPWELNMPKTLKDRAWAWDKWGGCKTELRNLDKTNSQVSGYATEGHYRKPDGGDSPWEYWNMQGVLKEKAQVRNQWGGNINESRNLNGDDNRWKHSCTWASGAVRDDSWGNCEGNSWRMWNEVPKPINQLSNLDNGVDNWNSSCNQANAAQRDNACGGWSQGWNYQNKSRNLDTVDDPWERGCQGTESMGFKQGGDLGNNPWGGNHWDNSIYKQNNVFDSHSPWKYCAFQGTEAAKDRSDSGDKSQGWKQWENHNNEPKKLESRKVSGGWGVWNGGCRKREGSHKNTSSYKCSRVQGDSYQTGHWGRKGRAKKRVNFFNGVDSNE